MPSLAFQTLPITYSALVVETTTQCNAKCDICYQYSGPKGSDKWGIKSLEEDILKKVIFDSTKIPSLNRRFHLAGGECFLDLNLCKKLFKHAQKCGYVEITATTNAFWASTPSKAEKILLSLKQSGLTRLEISWDIWHKQYVNGKNISHLVSACANHNISTNLRVLTTKKCKIDNSLNSLSNSILSNVDEISCCPVFFTGRASEKINEVDIYRPQAGFSGCHNVLSLTVNPKGFVFPCCAGLDQTDNINFGNIHNDSIINIAENMNSSLLLRMLVFEGPLSLAKILKENGIKMRTKFNNVCHMCWHIFNNSDWTKIVEDYFDEIYISSVQRAISKLKNVKENEQ